MKKFLILLLSICMLVSLIACESESTAKVNKFEQFEKGLTEKGIQFELVEKAASMVGAKEGYGYVFADDTAVEVYLFDTSTDAYKDAHKNSQIYLEAFEVTMDVVFNGDICIYFNGDPANKTEILNIFNGIERSSNDNGSDNMMKIRIIAAVGSAAVMGIMIVMIVKMKKK